MDRASVSVETNDELEQHRSETRHLRETIGALREQLEAAIVERNAAVQAAFAQSADELAQQQQTIIELRRSVESERADAARAREAGERAARSERDQLQEIIAALRARLEPADGG